MQGPITKLDLNNLEERDSDLDVLEQQEYPYMKGRLFEVDWKAIVAKKRPWKDPLFPHGAYALYMNHKGPRNANDERLRKWSEKFYWKRASQHFKDKDWDIFDGIDPSDCIMGSCNNCYMFAALGGMAEAHEQETDEKDFGERVRDNFLTQEVNEAGCYSI